MLDSYSSSGTNGATGGDGELPHNLTDPRWLLDRAAHLLPLEHHMSLPHFAMVLRTTGDLLIALGQAARHRGVELPMAGGDPIKAVRAWEAAVTAAAVRQREAAEREAADREAERRRVLGQALDAGVPGDTEGP